MNNQTARHKKLVAEEKKIEQEIRQESARIERAKNIDLAKITKHKNRLIFLIGSAVLKEVERNNGEEDLGFKITKEQLKFLLDRDTLLDRDRDFLIKQHFLNC